jgi:hypothetical protein
MRKRESFVVTVHRWLFRFSVGVIVASALSRIDDDVDRHPDRPKVAASTPADDDGRPPVLAFSACP